MKKIIVIGTCLLLAISCAFAKKKESDQTVSFEKIINVQGETKDELFYLLDSSFLKSLIIQNRIRNLLTKKKQQSLESIIIASQKKW